jgi:hypothetical protein
MPFTKFFSIVLEILCCYYFIIIVFDLLKSANKPVEVTTHTVQFDKIPKPVVISGDPGEDIDGDNSFTDENLIDHKPPKLAAQSKKTKKKTPLIDLGLETISGEPYTVNAKNLSKFMIP